MSALSIGVDLDGVLYSFHDAFRNWVNVSTGRPMAEMPMPETGPHCHDFYEHWGISRDEYKKLFAAGVDAGYIFATGEPLCGRDGLRALHELRLAGHYINVITHRAGIGKPGAAEDSTQFWLDLYAVPYDSVTFSVDKTVLWTDYFIEDNVGNYDALCAVGTHAVLLNQPWNMLPRDRRERVNSVRQFRNHVLSKDSIQRLKEAIA